MNDLWKFDGFNWTWIGGSDTHSQMGNYYGSEKFPSARMDSLAVTDNNGIVWMFGGSGIGTDNALGNFQSWGMVTIFFQLY